MGRSHHQGNIEPMSKEGNEKVCCKTRGQREDLCLGKRDNKENFLKEDDIATGR